MQTLRATLTPVGELFHVFPARGGAATPWRRTRIAVRRASYLAALIDELFELAKLDFKKNDAEPQALPFGELRALFPSLNQRLGP